MSNPSKFEELYISSISNRMWYRISRVAVCAGDGLLWRFCTIVEIENNIIKARNFFYRVEDKTKQNNTSKNNMGIKKI
jgi:hypothetical protein